MLPKKSVTAFLGLLLASSSHAAEIKLSCAAVGAEYKLCQSGAAAWAAKTGNEVTVISAPNDASDRLGLYQQMLAAESADIDIYLVDVTWQGILQNYFVDHASALNEGQRPDIFSAYLENNTVKGQLKAVPWYLDVGMLYYRSDLLEKYKRPVPRTWKELRETAQIVQDGERKSGNRRFWGYTFQARSYEGLTCNGVEWIAGYGAELVDAQGNVKANSPGMVSAFTEISQWINHFVPEGALGHGEEESRGLFQSGNAAFMRNWPYAWSLANSEQSLVKNKVGITYLPKGSDEGRHAGALGGWSLAVSKYSKHQKEALSLVSYLTSAAEQKRRFIEGGFSPALRSLYDDADIIKQQPQMKQFRDIFTNAVARPASRVGSKYNRVSSAFQEVLREVLRDQVKPVDAAKILADKLEAVKGGASW